MPRGYQLDTYYDSLRAVNRKIYSTQIKYLSGVIDRLMLRHTDVYKLIIASVNDGVYQNLGGLYSKTFYGFGPTKPGVTKSGQSQDYMSPMELRLNAIAVRRATRAIEGLNGRKFTLKDVQDICYAEARDVAKEFGILLQGEDEFNIRLPLPVPSTKSIIKKYDHGLVMGTLPKGKMFVSKNPNEINKKKELIIANNTLFSQVKNRLIELGMSSMSVRQTAFARFNMEYYEADVARTHTLEISKILITDKADDYVSEEEINLNIEKLKVMKLAIDKLSNGASYYDIYKALEEAGKIARHLTIQKHKVLPELYSGFYHTYIDSDKRIVSTKN